MIDVYLDSETTNLHNASPLDDPSQPDIIQLAAQMYEGRKLVHEFQFIMANKATSPISPYAEKAHGISQEFVSRHGVNPKLPLTALKAMFVQADRVFAFNMGFDWKLLQIAHARYFGDTIDHPGVYCSMLSAHGHVPKADGSARWPTLMEAYKHLVDPAGFEGAHDAMADVRALRDVTWALEDRMIQLKRPKGM